MLKKRERAMEPGAIGYASYRGAAALLAMRDGAMHGTLQMDSPDPARFWELEFGVNGRVRLGIARRRWAATRGRRPPR